ncbi:MAG: transposase [Bacteroidales bacterium]
MSKFPTAKHFCSWLGLAPNNKISGGKVLSSHTPKRKNRLAESLRNAANVIGNLKDNPLSEFFHRVAYKKGRMVAITATARKLATIIWNMLTRKEQFKTIDNEEYKKKIRDLRIKKMQRQIIQMGISSDELKLAG